VEMFDAGKTGMIGLPYGEKKLSRYVKPFSSDTGTSRTDRRTDGQTDRFAISISHMLTRDKNDDFRPISRFISEMMQDRAIVTMEGE